MRHDAITVTAACSPLQAEEYDHGLDRQECQVVRGPWRVTVRSAAAALVAAVRCCWMVDARLLVLND